MTCDVLQNQIYAFMFFIIVSLIEIWLEPKKKEYGDHLSSGRIRIAFARGNENLLSKDNEKIGINYLQSGIIMGPPDKIRARNIPNVLENGWHADFHNFTLIWEPGNVFNIIIFFLFKYVFTNMNERKFNSGTHSSLKNNTNLHLQRHLTLNN